MELIDVIVFHCCPIFIVVVVIVVVDSCNEVNLTFHPSITEKGAMKTSCTAYVWCQKVWVMGKRRIHDIDGFQREWMFPYTAMCSVVH